MDLLFKQFSNFLIQILGLKQDPDGSMQALIGVIMALAIVLGTVLFKRRVLQIGVVRKLIDGRQQFAGTYIEYIHGAGTDARISFLYIKYAASTGRYRLRGFQYDLNGVLTTNFRSEDVRFPDGMSDEIQFIWRADVSGNGDTSTGYTSMTFDDAADKANLRGSGFYIAFRDSPMLFPFEFERLGSGHHAFGVEGAPPDTRDGRAAWVQAFHKKWPDGRPRWSAPPMF